MEEGFWLGLFGTISSRLLVGLLLEELLRVVLHLALTGAGSFRDSRWGGTGFSAPHCEHNLSFVVICGVSRGDAAKFCR